MQRYKRLFNDPTFVGTVGNVQSCLRVDDLDEIGDGLHFLYFNMLGLFSFRGLTVGRTIGWWLEFLNQLDITPDYVTVHPLRSQWRDYFPESLEVREDERCTWTDGEMGGYCTEFHVGDLELGNIVNPNGDCIDVGFGLERLVMIRTGWKPTEEDVLRESVRRIIESGYEPGNKKQGYVLRRLLRRMVRRGFEMDHPYWRDERLRQQRVRERFERLIRKHPDESPQWWWETHGIDLSDVR